MDSFPVPTSVSFFDIRVQQINRISTGTPNAIASETKLIIFHGFHTMDISLHEILFDNIVLIIKISARLSAKIASQVTMDSTT